MNKDLMELYENNEDFKLYVDKCCANDGYHKTASLEEVLDREITREVAKMYSNNPNRLDKNIRSTFMPQGECI